MRWISSLLVLAALFLVATFLLFESSSYEEEKIQRAVGPIGLPQGPYNQQLWWIPVESIGDTVQQLLLETMVYAPSGQGPFPLVVLNHGKPTPGSDLRSIRPGFDAAARWFVDRGFIVAVPLRRGYGHSQGAVADMAGTCATLDYVATAKQTAVDIESIIGFMTRQSIVDQRNVVVVGHSHGGFGALGVAADAFKGVVGVVNFAGGTGLWKPSTGWQWIRRIVQGKICNGRQNFLAALAQLGEQNSVAQVWLYAENDELFNPELAQEMLNAYEKKSRFPIFFISLPPSLSNGHMLFAEDTVTSWAPAVNGFLKKLHIPGYLAGD
jgi:dienelactone hydrolase